ncbi:hypothetical protein MTR67_036103 [Solanum verrucosum]|uniref:SWIM-type domain-containing protein n=1 Tax=Solanum verrucosum TaxID=315347 RepID=A0AAF0UBE3_SOLVR|nr:hypothetical protein MTR67_036103 [Solanum verrucosum]
MEESLIFTKIYQGGILSEIFVPTYVGNCVSALRYIIKDHFSILELLYYTKELGYETVGGFYVKDLLNKKWVLITTDQHLLHLIKDLKHEDTFEVFVYHVLDEPLLDTEGPKDYLTNVCGKGVDVDLGEKGEAVNLGGEGEAIDLSGEGEAVNLGGEGVDVNIGEEGVDDNLGKDGVDDNLGGKGESDFLSSDSNLDIPSEDGSDIDDELRDFRQERRNKKQRKKAIEFEEIPVREAGGIDRGFEDIEKIKTDKYAGKLGGDEDYIDSSDCWSDDSDEQLDVDAVRGVDIPTRRRSKKLRYDEDCEVSIFELGMVFESANQFRKAVADYAVEYMRQIKLRPNEKHRVREKCKNANCKWLLYASIDRDSGDFIVKNYHPVHKCIPLNRNKLCYSKAKQRIMKENMGDWKVEFARLCDYADMIKQTNPGSSCRGACKGELLVVVGKNGNNQMYPIAWAVVDTETKHSWSWFIRYLIVDLNLGTGEGLTVMSDMQKGLIPVLSELLPNAEKRMCARHIWSNWHVNWKGEERRKQFWRCSKASFEVKFGEEVHAMSKLGKKEITEDLLHYDPRNWSRAFFQTHSKCDVVENNMCETFNSWILAARHKSIITMLEDIRHKMMNRHIDMIKFAETWISDIAPMARAILERNKEYSNNCNVQWNELNGFEISEREYSFVVDLEKKHCDCRLWMLRGIPCPHAICAYYYLNQDPDQHVEHWYKKEIFLKAYIHFIQPIPNMRMWPETTNPSIEPPKPRKIPGKPGKKRRKSKDEPKKWGKLSRKGVKMTCTICKKTGHNKAVCARVRTQSSQQSSICADTTVVPRTTQITSTMGGPSHSTFRTTYATTQSSQPSSICADIESVPRRPQNRVQVGTGRGLGRKKANARGTPIVTESDSSSSQLPPLSGHKRPYKSASFAAATGGNRRPTTGFGVYSNPITGAQVFNPGPSSEKILHGPTKLKSASPTNIDIGFKPRGLKWKGKDAVSTSQLQQMKANRKN